MVLYSNSMRCGSANCEGTWSLLFCTHFAGVVTFVSPVEALDAANRLGLFLWGLTLVDIQTGGGYVNDKQTNQVTEIEL